MANTLKPINTTNDVFTDTIEKVEGMFANGAGTLEGTSMFTAALSSSDQKYFATITDAAGSSGTEFIDLAYGDSNGSGSDIGGGVNNTQYETKAVYHAFAGTLLDDARDKFVIENVDANGNFTSAITESQMYFITPKTAVMKDRIHRNWTVTFTGSNGDQPNAESGGHVIAATGSTLALTTYSGSNLDSGHAGKYWLVVSGSSGNSAAQGAQTVYGHFYENYGIIALSATRLSSSIPGEDIISGSTGTTGTENGFGQGFAVNTATDGTAKNHLKLYNCLVSGSVSMRTVSVLNQTSYYCRAMHHEFNHTANETFVKADSTTGDIIDDFAANPTVYVTGVGLYNSNSELIAAAKLNKPQKKDHNTELIVKVVLNG